MADYATLLRDHVRLTCRCVDRIFLQAYVPKLQSVGWVCQFLNRQRGFAIPLGRWFRGFSRMTRRPWLLVLTPPPIPTKESTAATLESFAATATAACW